MLAFIESIIRLFIKLLFVDRLAQESEERTCSCGQKEAGVERQEAGGGNWEGA